MHKIFAKTLFLGKHVVYLPECHSTNTVASEMAAKSGLAEGTVVVTDKQTKGRGQRGNTWESAAGKNLTFTLVLKPAFLKLTDQFSMSMLVSLAVRSVFEKFSEKSDVRVKWPNDIYIGENKCAGILIENSLRGNKLDYMLVGIGMNVNQAVFPLEGATSLFLETGLESELREVLLQTLLTIEKYYLLLKNKGVFALRPEYLSYLLWKDELHVFQSADRKFTGKILGVDRNGRLVVESDSGQESYEVKEISFIK